MSAMLGKNTVNETFIRQSIGNSAWDDAVSDLSGRVLPPAVAYAGLTMAEKVALYTWTLDTSQGPWFARINAVLRGAVNDSYEIATVQPLIAGIESALEKLPPYEGVVYRAVKEGKMNAETLAWFNDVYQNGNKVALDGFSGASMSMEGMLRGRFKLVLASKSGRDISAFSAKPGQAEILLSHGTMIMITQVKRTQNGAVWIWAQEI